MLKWQPFVNTAMNVQVSQNKISWPRELLLPFPRRTWFRGTGILIVDNKTGSVRITLH
jgi:hypothetical protein